MIPLCCPPDHRARLSSLGAEIDATIRRLTMPSAFLRTEQWRAFAPYLPARFHPERPGPYLQPRPVPLPLWGWNLRALLERRDWDRIRRDAYASSGQCCRICGGVGAQHPVEADEIWVCDDVKRVQSLSTVCAICPACHAVRHWGRTTMLGAQSIALEHMAHVNRLSLAACQALVDARMAEWVERSALEWTLDITWIENRYAMSPRPDARANAEAVHAALLARHSPR
ncbi:hypothetical protein [Asaia sp. As-1742]|uniref:hypothetical protein n=1 Tax=Asaia sp. As-1742 TaxID=2608325 RepID=UPI001423C01F|nr:hypothetical protein [Asaia sp. As-1742]